MPVFTTNTLDSQTECNFRITVTDSHGNSSSVETGNISINPAIEPPVLAPILDQDITIGVANVITPAVSGTAPFTYSGSAVNNNANNAWVTDWSSSSITITPTALGLGRWRFNATNSAGTDEKYFYLTVVEASATAYAREEDISDELARTANSYTLTSVSDIQNLPTLFNTYDTVIVPVADYSSQSVANITAAGTSSVPKVLMSADPAHPFNQSSASKLPALSFLETSHYIVSGFEHADTATCYRCEDIIFDKPWLHDGQHSIDVVGSSTRVKAQHGLFQRIKDITDGACFNLNGHSWRQSPTQGDSYSVGPYTFEDCGMVGCEFEDVNQAMQLISGEDVANDGAGNALQETITRNDFKGCYFEDFSVRYTSWSRTNASGIADVNGTNMKFEGQVFVYKSTSSDSLKPITVKRGYIEGTRSCKYTAASAHDGNNQILGISGVWDSTHGDLLTATKNLQIDDITIKDSVSEVRFRKDGNLASAPYTTSLPDFENISCSNVLLVDHQNHSNSADSAIGRGINVLGGSTGLTITGTRAINTNIPIAGATDATLVVDPTAGSDKVVHDRLITDPAHTVTISKGNA